MIKGNKSGIKFLAHKTFLEFFMREEEGLLYQGPPRGQDASQKPSGIKRSILINLTGKKGDKVEDLKRLLKEFSSVSQEKTVCEVLVYYTD